MAQHDYNIANQSGADFRADLNNALLAIATVNSGATEPSTTFAHQLWVDTSSSVLKIRNAADNAWITTGVSITASNTFTGDLTGNVTGNLTGNVTGNVTGDLTGNADSADTLSTARTISLSGDVVGSASFDGSANIDIDTVVQINSITLGTDTTGDYVESLSGGTGVTVTGGTGEGSTPSIAIGQAVATTDNVTFNTITASNEFIGDIDGAVRFTAKADETLSKGDVVYVSGVSGNTPTVGKAKADDASKMPAFGLAAEDANANNNLQIVTLGNLTSVDTSNESVGEILYVSTTAGEYTTTAPSGESAQIQNIGKVLRSHAVNGSIKVGGAGRSNATPNLDNGKIFIGNGSNQAVTSTLDTSIVVENTNLYYTTTRANTDFDTRLATKDTGDLTEGSNLYYTTARVNSDFDTRLATKDTGDLAEGSNLYYTDARVNSAFDTRLATKDTDDLTEGTTNLYYTSGRANSDFDTRLATKSTTDLAEGTNLYYTSARFDSAFTSKDTDDLSEGTTNLYYTTARFDSAFGNKTTSDLTEGTNLYYTDTRANSAIDTRVTKAFVDALGIQASSVDANSVTLGTDTVGNYVATVTGTANKITVTGSGSESANITLSLPDDVQIASDLTVAGNLTVNGTLTSLDTTNLDIEDNLFQLNAGLTGSPVNDSGMLINRGNQDNGIFMWDESVDKFTMGLTTADGSATGNITLNSLGTLVANIEGNVTGAVTGTVSSLSNHDTGDLAEGSNLYYTQARFDSAFTAKSTSDLSEGSNLYYTDARFDTRLATKDTDDVSEGTSNLYYTTARFDSAFGGKSTSDLSEGSNLYYTDARVQAVSINNVVEDTTPQLGGNLDLNSSDITGTGNINITGTIQSSGNITGTLATAAQTNITSLGTLSALTVTGEITANGGIALGDNDKATFGAGDDLQIYHDGSNSFIHDFGTGNLSIKGTNLTLGDSGGNDYIVMTDTGTGGTVEIKHNAVTKLATTSTGIDVTGTATMDGLTVDGGAGNSLINFTPSGTFSTVVSFANASSAFDIVSYGSGSASADNFRIRDNGASRFNIAGNGDISFYEDTGTSQALFWDASAESLGIGTTSPSTILHTSGSSATVYNAASVGGQDTSATLRIQNANTSANSFASIDFNTNNNRVVNRIVSSHGSSTSNGFLAFVTEGSGTPAERLRIDSSGNVGIGITSPSYKLDLNGDMRFTTNSTLFWADTNVYEGRTGNDRYWVTGGSERMRIDSSGNLLVGTTDTFPGFNDTNTGTSITSTGRIFASASGEFSQFNRNSSDGDILQFRKDGSAVGSIGAEGGDLVIGTGSTAGLQFNDATPTVRPWNMSANSRTDGVCDLGYSNSRFKDLYLSGTVALTTADNASAANMFVSPSTDFLYLEHPSNGMIFRNTAGAERMRIDSSGLLKIGTSGTVTPYSLSRFAIDTGTYTYMDLLSTGSSGINFGDAGGAQRGTIEYDHGSDFMRFGSAGGERLRIDSSGNLLVGGTAAGVNDSCTIDQDGIITIARASGTGRLMMTFKNGGASVGTITTTASSTAYNTSSDARLKDVTGEARGLEVINELNPVAYNWKADGKADEGLIAQEVLDIVPNAVSGSEEEMYQMDYSKLVVHLVAGMKEQQTQIEALQSEINLLKGE